GQSANILFCNTAFGPSEPPPNPPRNLTATPSDLIVNLAWDAPDPGPEPTGYAVYRDGTKVADLPVAERAYSDGGLANGTPYCYVVRATRGALQSNPSNEACATPGAAGQIFHRGDADDNGSIQLTDALRVLGYLFLGGEEPTCVEAFDADDNGQVQLTDALRILGFLFLGGLEPAPPGPPGSPCGPDPEGSPDLGCTSYTSC
ncbi:MAG TPA: hypothetical protein VMT52_06630, partial [Planctomycetota bacterium]|nr:hypothetical protein [Planctomycetota bacterium]